MDYTEYINSAKDRIGYSELKDFQTLCVNTLLNGRDLFLSQQTGMGKSAVYELLPLAMDAYLAKESGPGNQPELSAVLVISPLISLMEEQTKILNSKNLAALHLDMSEVGITEKLLISKPSYVFASPEAILQGGRAILKSRAFNQRLKAIYIDESHCISKW